ncbi:protein SCO1/2 [Algoriphagus aquaeductus]|uniref:Protein SCO1/2 n=1 Tax=Algoriphagus aquaeductus TaxID=475299 RepID=A0A326RN23_9BACT|nr:SCO family protein [Algoriphagus aquaeductus]PZV76758.1 protein SCO1/2 [Algoriphagus aquaeductus]
MIILLAIACKPGNKPDVSQLDLPILGERYVDDNQDTVYHRIADFSLVNQLGDTITNSDVSGKVYVADFFFTSCPTICPVMKKEMLRVYEKYQENPNFKILSHSIDVAHDTPEVLKDYAEKLGVESASTWNFLTGDQEKIFELGQTSYLTTAMADQLEPGGFLHSGAFLLIDQQGRIRGVYDGTKSDQVDRLINDIPKILK